MQVISYNYHFNTFATWSRPFITENASHNHIYIFDLNPSDLHFESRGFSILITDSNVIRNYSEFEAKNGASAFIHNE